MSTEDLVRAWKDPDQRGEHPGIDHPAGGIELTGLDAAGGAEEELTPNCTVTVTITIINTNFGSCWLSCEKTYFKGTCGAFSIGCCD